MTIVVPVPDRRMKPSPCPTSTPMTSSSEVPREEGGDVVKDTGAQPSLGPACGREVVAQPAENSRRRNAFVR